jgi:hypothetical protein
MRALGRWRRSHFSQNSYASQNSQNLTMVSRQP